MAADRQFCYCWVDFQITKVRKKNMLHLIWYIFVGFLVGCVAKALMHTHLIDHVDRRARYRRLDHWRRCNPPVLSAKCRGQISPRRINCFNRWGDSSFVRLAQVQTAAPSRIACLLPVLISRGRDGPPGPSVHVPRRARRSRPTAYSPAKLTWISSTLGWNCARSRFPNCEKRPLCLYG